MENWKAVPGYEGFYEVSDLGRVRRITIQILKGEDSHGYRRVSLCRKCKHKKFGVHTLVMLAFVGPAPKGKEVNHKFGVRDDNRLTQLEYMTKKENQIHARDILKRRFQHGSDHGRHKLTEKEVLKIRKIKTINPSISQKKLAGMFKVNVPTISMILSRRTWRHI